ncbi:MAG: hypothetical protein WED33_11055 [Bacteroidia bacterium]
MLRILLSCFFLILAIQAESQKSIRYFIPADFHAGASLANMEGSQMANVSNNPGLTLSAFTGFMARYKDRFGMALEGGFTINGYQYSSSFNLGGLNVQNSEYNIQHFAWSTKARAFYLIPLKNNRHSVLRIGIGAGYLFLGQDQEFGQSGAMSVFTEIDGPPVTFIEPEIGLSKLMGKSQIDLGITYHHNFGDARAFTSRITVPTGTATAYSRLNYLAVVLRFQPEILRKRKTSPERAKPTIIRAAPQLAELPEISQRNTRERISIDLKHKKAVLKFKDNSEIDGDTISVYVNGMPVLIDYGLVKKEHKIRIELEPGANSITIVAKNEGKVPPNTAACRIRSGLKTYQLTTSTSMRQNEVIKINYVE